MHSLEYLETLLVVFVVVADASVVEKNVIAKVAVAHNVVEDREGIVNTCHMVEMDIVDILVLRMFVGIVDNVFVALVVLIKQNSPLYF
jgi:hypothetical protein